VKGNGENEYDSLEYNLIEGIDTKVAVGDKSELLWRIPEGNFTVKGNDPLPNGHGAKCGNKGCPIQLDCDEGVEHAATTSEVEITDPTDKSSPPEIMTKVWPYETTPRIEEMYGQY
jgi:hypothetical protein